MHRARTSVAAAAAGAVMAVASSASADATTSTVSPGDELVHVAEDSPHRCTLGYTFTNFAGRTFGITAGHCGAGGERYVLDRTTGTTGRFVVTVITDDEPFQDYALIDFGASRSVPIMKGMPVTGVTLPDNRNAICHTGIATGVACGQLADSMLANQYLTTGMARSIPGDSGGPVWQLNADATSATVVGIWLGEHNNSQGGRNRSFYPPHPRDRRPRDR
jgi:streptogrisin B